LESSTEKHLNATLHHASVVRTRTSEPLWSEHPVSPGHRQRKSQRGDAGSIFQGP